MINFKLNKTVFKPNELGSLYIKKNTLKLNDRPIIYISGQGEHRQHIVEKYGFSIYSLHNAFDGDWVYEYPNNSRNKKEINAINFSDNLCKSLEMANLDDVDLVTSSFGGIVGAYASKNPRVHNVYAIHPPILGTPLANPDYLEQFKSKYTTKEKLLLFLLKRIVNTSYGFQKDNFNGIDPRLVDLNKLTVIGNDIDPSMIKDEVILGLYNIILKSSGLKNDCMVTFDEKRLNELGINYVRDNGNNSHFTYEKTVFKRLKKLYKNR